MLPFDPSRDARPPQQFYDAAEGMDALVWRICEYRRDDCLKCPTEVQDAAHGLCKQGCRAIAEEVVAIVLASCEPDADQTFTDVPLRFAERDEAKRREARRAGEVEPSHGAGNNHG